MEPKYYGAAANYNKPAGGAPINKKIFLIAGLVVGVLILLMVAFSVFSAISQGPQNDFARLVARQSTLRTLLEEQQGNISSSDLRGANATARILVTGDEVALIGQLQTAFGLESVPESVAALEADPTVATDLENARLTGTFDQTYVNIVREHLASLSGLAQSIYASSGSSGLREVLDHQVQNLSAIDEQLAALEF